MGLSEEQLVERANTMKNMKTFAPSDNVPYIFISYKSDDWKIVLDEIVRTLVNNYSLRVYYDANFDKNNKLWCKNMVDAMETESCKGILAFLSDNYANSYACVMEMLNSTAKSISLSHQNKRLEIIPIIIDEKIKYIDDLKGKFEPADITEWDDYNRIIDDVLKNQDKLDSDYISYVENVKNKGQDVKLQQLTHCIRGVLKNAQLKYFNKESHVFYDNLCEAIKSISTEVFDEALKGTCGSDNNKSSDVKKETKTENAKKETIVPKEEDAKKEDPNKDHYEKVKTCVINEIEKYKKDGKLLSVGNSKNSFATKAINDTFKCSEFDNNSAGYGNLIGYYIGIYGLTKNSWNTFTFNLGLENIDKKGVVKDQIMALQEARTKLKADGVLDKLIKDAEEKGLKITVNYDDTLGKVSKNVVTTRFNDDSDDEKVLTQNIDSALSWIESFEKELFQKLSK